jgi:hypothetical protein
MSRCQTCPIPNDRTCRADIYPDDAVRLAICDLAASGDPLTIHRLRQAAGFDDPLPPVNGVSWEAVVAIETCSARTSTCNCLGVPALCRRDPEPAMRLCLTAGPDGGPCPGA